MDWAGWLQANASWLFGGGGAAALLLGLLKLRGGGGVTITANNVGGDVVSGDKTTVNGDVVGGNKTTGGVVNILLAAALIIALLGIVGLIMSPRA